MTEGTGAPLPWRTAGRTLRSIGKENDSLFYISSTRKRNVRRACECDEIYYADHTKKFITDLKMTNEYTNGFKARWRRQFGCIPTPCCHAVMPEKPTHWNHVRGTIHFEAGFFWYNVIQMLWRSNFIIFLNMRIYDWNFLNFPTVVVFAFYCTFSRIPVAAFLPLHWECDAHWGQPHLPAGTHTGVF